MYFRRDLLFEMRIWSVCFVCNDSRSIASAVRKYFRSTKECFNSKNSDCFYFGTVKNSSTGPRPYTENYRREWERALRKYRTECAIGDQN